MKIKLTENSLIFEDEDPKLLQKLKDDIFEMKIIERAMRK